MDKKHYVYILRCADGTLYTGWTTDVEKRLETHNSGRGAKYTRSRRPVELVYTEEFNDKIEAQHRERAIKKLPRSKKAELITGGQKMTYLWRYKTPEGFDDLLIESDGDNLTGLRFEKTDCENITGLRVEKSGGEKKHILQSEEKELPIFKETEKWLDAYFAGEPLNEIPKIKVINQTDFRKEVMAIVSIISYGETVTYGYIANKIAEKRGLIKMSAQAIGGAVGSNPICIIIPCHRVVGSDGSLTGYGGGIENKRKLLEHEQRRIK